jgi:hypothetical protein
VSRGTDLRCRSRPLVDAASRNEDVDEGTIGIGTIGVGSTDEQLGGFA